MAKFQSSQIRNICLLGHGGDGKTSLNEAMLYLAKATDRLGKTADGKRDQNGNDIRLCFFHRETPLFL